MGKYHEIFKDTLDFYEIIDRDPSYNFSDNLALNNTFKNCKFEDRKSLMIFCFKEADTLSTII
jgi:hypothetical protein